MQGAFREHEFLSWLRDQTRSTGQLIPVPLGDDAALIAGTEGLLIAMDTVCEGSHAASGPDLPEQLARKAVRSNLSDIAAMGGRAETVLCALELPRRATAELAKRTMRAILAECARYAVTLVGGDTVVRDGPMAITVTVTGRLLGAPVLRSGARPGELIVVTGELGGSLAGRHHDFEPRLDEAAWLVAAGPPTAMTDISDGLVRDLANILVASGCGAVLDAAAIPCSMAAQDLSQTSGRRPLDHALEDGEDFELLFTWPASGRARLEQDWKFGTPLHVIGHITEAGLGLMEQGAVRDLPVRGFEHRSEPENPHVDS
ncbi:MAG: thiamine-monophosphate kinase [Planctomycetes bacterium]|nr:thiamine-monophosphate kinase [Planctomycetota bacterium]